VDILDKKIFDDGIINNIEESIAYVKKHIDVRYEIKAAKRKEISQFPEEVFREAIVNSIMHRDYFDKSGDVLIEIFKNKIIISNPGGLVKWLKPEDFGKYSRARNQIIADLLSRTRYVEKVGSGINRIKDAMIKQGLPEPIFEYNFSFATVLFDKTGGRDLEKDLGKNLEKDLGKNLENLTKNQRKILKEIEENKNITQEELSKIIGINEKNIRINISKLKKMGLINRIGPDKGGYWEIIK
jgi:ATP-dependent DNA helicase RecG